MVRLDEPPKPISPDLFGIFFEDINYAADGGLYAELVENRSFDYHPTERLSWNPLTSWEHVQRGGGRGSVAIDSAVPLHPNNPLYAVVEAAHPGAGVGLRNGGFGGITVKAGETYNVSLLARHLYTGQRWKQSTRDEAEPAAIVVQLETAKEELLARTTLDLPAKDWTRLTGTLEPTRSESDARLVVMMTFQGGIALDMVSLFPARTFHDRPNGLRADLAQAVADLKPKFMRFPGGCLVHGNGLGNMYRWKETIGPIEQRKGQRNLWGYHQSVGLGFFEYFQFCEDIGAKPLPVLPAAVSCQNSDYAAGTGQRALPLDQMQDYIQEVLDLIEYANGPPTSTWGAKRAAAGHPEPFHLQYLGIGNEDHITPEFKERFKLIYDALRQKHPQITVIGTVGPFWRGEDFEKGWEFARELNLAMVDEHYYESPAWFRSNLARYDGYDRRQARVYVGEYASRGNTLANALAEAAYMTGLERNGDVVQLASYAPLLAKHGHIQWYPDLIYFTNTQVFPSTNYHVQRLFSTNSGSQFVAHSLTHETNPQNSAALAVSVVRENETGHLIMKLVNTGAGEIQTVIDLEGMKKGDADATATALSGQPEAINPGDPRAKVAPDTKPLVPVTSPLKVDKSFKYRVPPYSLSVLRIKVAP